MQLFASLKHTPFAFLWTGQTLSRLGDHVQRIALAWWVLEKTGSAAAMGTVLTFTTVPMLIFLLVGGVAVDRFSRTRVMLASDILRGLLVALLALLSLTNRLELWHIYVISIFFGFISAFFQPAYTAMVPDITPREVLPSANSLTTLSGQMVGVLGPAAGAYIVKIVGTGVAFSINSLSFFVSALCLLPLLGLSVKPLKTSTSVLNDLRAGLEVVWRSPWLWITIIIASLANMALAGSIGVVLPFLVQEHLGADVDTMGLILSMLSVGSVSAAILLGRQAELRRRGLMAYVGWMLVGLMVFLMGLPIGLMGTLLAGMIVGVGMSTFGLIWMNTLQELVPREMLGRVASMDQLGSYLFLPIGYALAGWGTEHVGAALVFVISGLLMMGLMGIGLLHPSIRGLD